MLAGFKVNWEKKTLNRVKDYEWETAAQEGLLVNGISRQDKYNVIDDLAHIFRSYISQTASKFIKRVLFSLLKILTLCDMFGNKFPDCDPQGLQIKRYFFVLAWYYCPLDTVPDLPYPRHLHHLYLLRRHVQATGRSFQRKISPEHLLVKH